MTVIGQFPVEYRRYNGHPERAFPSGAWLAIGTVTGDATGGNAIIDLVFAPAQMANLDSRLYSVEDFAASTQVGTTSQVLFRTVLMGGAGATLSTNHRKMFEMVAAGGPAVAAVRGRESAFLPIFLGAPSRAGITISLEISFPNADTVVFDFEAEGYWWGPEAVLASGGPQRPLTGLYRA